MEYNGYCLEFIGLIWLGGKESLINIILLRACM